MSSSLIRKDFVDSFFKIDAFDLWAKHIFPEQFKFYNMFQHVAAQQVCSFQNKIQWAHRIITTMNDSFPKEYNDLHLLAKFLLEFKNEPQICFEAAKKIISLGINIDSAIVREQKFYTPDNKFMTSLDLALHTISSPSLVALLVIHGASCFMEEPSEIKEEFELALNPLFNRMKILILAKTDKESTLFKLLPKEMISEIAYNQLWVEAHTFREQTALSLYCLDWTSVQMPFILQMNTWDLIA